MKTTLTICLVCLSVCNYAFAQPNSKTPLNPNNAFANDASTAVVLGKTVDQIASTETAKSESEEDSNKLFLKPKKSTLLFGGKSKSGKSIPGSPESMAITFGILAAMIIGILICAKFMKRKNPTLGKTIPNEAFEVLGRKSINTKQSIQFFRCGSKILIVSASDDGLNTLSEIVDPVEVDFISGLCRSEEKSGSSSQMFRNLFSKKVAEDRALPVQAPQRQQPAAPINPPSHLDLVSEQLDRAVLQQQLNQKRAELTRTSQRREERRA